MADIGSTNKIVRLASSRRGAAWLALGLALIGVLRIVSTYAQFNHTSDEPAHLACGLELLQWGEYTLESQHPPLARVAAAVGPYLDGVRLPGVGDMTELGVEVLYAAPRYYRTLTLARMGELPFYGLILLGTWLVAREVGSRGVALTAVFFASCSPALLAHSGIATTDAALTGSLMLAIGALLRRLRRPTFGASLLLGFAVGLALASKISAIPFFGAIVLISLWFRARIVPIGTRESRLDLSANSKHAAVIALTAIAILWISYGASMRLEPLRSPERRPYARVDSLLGDSGATHDAAYSALESIRLPPFILIYLDGIHNVQLHNLLGHKSFFLGERGKSGWIMFFPTVMALGMTAGLLILGLAGFFLMFREGRRDGHWPLAAIPWFAASIVAIAMTSRLSMGIRHILPVPALFAVGAAFACSRAYRLDAKRRLLRRAALGLAIAHAAAGVWAHPDYLGYFNFMAGPDPSKVFAYQDWGQDLDRLARELWQRKIESVRLLYWGSADPARHNIPGGYRPLTAGRPPHGWVAISIGAKLISGYPLPWLNGLKPVARIGTSIELYHLDP